MKHFTLRSFFTGLIGLLIITTSSMYVSLRMGALPWPTIFVAVLSMTILGKAKNSTLQEINITHTLMSSGAMVAGGLAFTLPGIWILNPDAVLPITDAMIVCVLGAVLGSLFSAVFRKNLVEEQALVFPIGNAAYNTLITGIKKSRESITLFLSMGLSIIFTIFRDAFALLPSVFTLFGGNAHIPMISFWVSPMAFAIGAVIDKMAALCWFGGAVISYFVLAPLGCSELFRQNIGIGLMIGTGIGILVKAFAKIICNKDRKAVMRKQDILFSCAVILGSAVILTFGADLSLLQACIAVFLVGVSCLLSGMLTGQSGINPMEIFGILVMLAVGFVRQSSVMTLFLVASLTAVACGLSGDVMNDLKSGYLLHTNPFQQVLAEFLGGTIGAVIAVFCLFAMKKAYGSFGTPALPAPQAKAVASMAAGFGNSTEFFVAIAIGTVLFLMNIPSATLGLGIYLSMQISLPVGLGALITYFAVKKFKANDINLVASGLLGGEGIAGVLIAIFSMF